MCRKAYTSSVTPILLCLHGWGGSKESFKELRAALAGADVDILTPDLPGFGTQKEPPTPWTVEDYAVWVKRWLLAVHPEEEILRKGLFLLGHSHGGRIAIVLTAKEMLPVSHLFLCASAGIRRARHGKRILGLMLAKVGKVFFKAPGLSALEPTGKKLLYKLVRVHDYEQASPLMQQTLMLVTAEDLKPLLPNIHVPTDIFWGELDGMTPVQDGILMEQLIPGSTLRTYPETRHAVHRDRAVEIGEVIRKYAWHEKMKEMKQQ